MAEPIEIILTAITARQERFAEVEVELSDPEIYRQRERFVSLSRERTQLQKIIAVCERCQLLHTQLAEANELLATEEESEVREMAESEVQSLTAELEQSVIEARLLLLPIDERDQKSCIVEVRAGTGGEEASLFAADVFRMYSRYAERNGWGVSIISSSDTEIGGYREIIFSLSGEGFFR